ncbi:MAG: antibiotic biosynthesis monooxygenase [Tannerellaceae bacterium]|jgi:quinol monooxygenase YgiN|nr:antibiotic biosynthesis monooxygenase [Tannerellaceae bacterium]
MKKGIKSSVLFSVFCSVLLFASCTSAVKEKETAAEVNTAESLTIIANITVYPEFKDELLTAIEAVVKATRQEEGNISYDVFEDINTPLRFTFIENWKSQSAIASHNASAHFLEFVKAVENKADLEAFTLKQKF